MLGLKGFSRDYKEQVASGALRGLIRTIQRDNEDIETMKATLETILVLFMTTEGNVDNSDDISLWLADGFTQSQENLSSLIALLDIPSFYVRLHVLQLLSLISSHRPQRTQDCVFASPLGTARLVSVLDDSRDAVRNEGLLLLIHLSEGSPDLQKLIAFENAFEKIFRIISEEITGIVVIDALHLLSNLLRYNPSNQNFFRETSCMPQLMSLLRTDWDAQVEDNLSVVLDIIRLFVSRGALSTPGNQQALSSAGLLSRIIQIGFGHDTPLRTRAEALITTGDLLRSNSGTQQQFSSSICSLGGREISTTDALVHMALYTHSVNSFDLRLAATSCLDGLFDQNPHLLEEFAKSSIQQFSTNSSLSFLDGLLTLSTDVKADPYEPWFACVIGMRLVAGSSPTKDLLRSIDIVDEDNDADKVTFLQTIASNLVMAITQPLDFRIVVGFLTFLIVFLHNDASSNADFLEESGSIQELVSFTLSGKDPIIQGLCAILLGVVYETSSSKSPLPRKTIHTLITSRIGRDVFLNRLMRLRESPLLRDFGSLVWRRDSLGLPDVIFDQLFVEFLKDNFSRIQRSIDKDPADDELNGIDEDPKQQMIEALQSQLSEKDTTLIKAQTTLESLQNSYTETVAGLRKRLEDTIALHKAELSSRDRELANLRGMRNENDILQKDLKSTKETAGLMFQNHRREITSLREANTALESEKPKWQEERRKLQGDLRRSEARVESEKKIRAEQVGQLQAQISDVEDRLSKSQAHNQSQQSSFNKMQEEMEAENSHSRATVEILEGRIAPLQDGLVNAQQETKRIKNELDDMLLVMQELSEKRDNDKKRLREAGLAISENESDEGSSDGGID